MSSRTLGCAIFVGAAFVSRAASARAPTDEDFFEAFYAEEPQAGAREQTEWYGWQILLVDGALLAGFAGSGAADQWGLAGVDMAAYAFASPIIHGAHGNTFGGGVSLLLHVAFPLAGAGIGWLAGLPATSCAQLVCIDFGNPAATAYAGTLLGATLATMFDAFALARTSAAASSRASWTLAPTALPSGGGLAAVGIF